MPALRESGMSGQMEYVSDLRIFNDHPRTAQVRGQSTAKREWRCFLDMHRSVHCAVCCCCLFACVNIEYGIVARAMQLPL